MLYFQTVLTGNHETDLWEHSKLYAVGMHERRDSKVGASTVAGNVFKTIFFWREGGSCC